METIYFLYFFAMLQIEISQNEHTQDHKVQTRFILFTHLSIITQIKFYHTEKENIARLEDTHLRRQ